VRRERKYIFHPNILQLPVGEKRKNPSRKLSGLQTREGGEAEKEVAENTQDYNGECFLFQLHCSSHAFHGGAPEQARGTAAVSDTSGDRSQHNGTQGPCGLTPTRTEKQVSTGPKYKQFVSGQFFESSSDGGTADYDRV
jgi:hypothetical protein